MTAHENRRPALAFGMTLPQRAALARLMDAPGWKERPCEDAKAWDIQFSRGSTLAREIEDRIATCDACELFPLCDAYAATNPATPGVIAGRVIEGQDVTA